MLDPSRTDASSHPRTFRSGGGHVPQARPIVRASPSPHILEHAKILLDYFNQLKSDSQTDVELKSAGRLVCTCHRLVLSAFSPEFRRALLTVQDSPTAELDINPQQTGIPWNVLEEVVDFCYTGQCRFSDKLLHAARKLHCTTLTDLLEKAQVDSSSSPSYLHQQVLVAEYHAATFLDELYQMKNDGSFLDCTFSYQAQSKEQRSESMKMHRLVLCAYARHFENTVREHAERVPQLSFVIDHPQLRMTKLDLICVVDFFYSGYVRAVKKRLRSIRAASLFIGAERLVAEIDILLENGGEEEEGREMHMQQVQYEEVNEMDYTGEGSATRPGSSMMHQREGSMEEEEYIGGDDDDEQMMQSPYMGEYDYSQAGTPMQQQQSQHLHDPSDMVGSSIDEYSQIYEQFVEGPKGGKRGGTYPPRPQTVKAKAPAVLVPESDEAGDEGMPAVTVNLAPPANSRRREVDSYGYRLPEIHAPTEYTVPLVVGDQQEMMERPFKCPYCDHRTREKSAVEKHVRSIHTNEAPFTCRFCPQKFKVQSNLVRHHRAHTGEKPYVCRKCGIAYADKKNMDAHVYREHLKQRQLTCDYPSCTSKFWRQDRYLLHYTKQHGPYPDHDQEGATREEEWEEE